jgi:hypothetical protein
VNEKDKSSWKPAPFRDESSPAEKSAQATAEFDAMDLATLLDACSPEHAKTRKLPRVQPGADEAKTETGG